MDEDDVIASADEALEALRAGEAVRAVAILDRLVEARPDDAGLRSHRAYALLCCGHAAESRTEAHAATELDGSMCAAWWVRGYAAWRLGRLSEAQEAFGEAVRLSHRDPEMLAEYAAFLAAARGPRLAEEAGLEAVRAAPDSADAWTALGRAQLRLHRHAQAESSLRRALELDPTHPAARAAMAELLAVTRREEKAAALAELMSDDPATQAFADQVRGWSRDKQVRLKLYERQEFQDAVLDGRRCRGWWYYGRPILMWLAIAGIAVGGAAVAGWHGLIIAVPAIVGVWILAREH